MTRPVRGVERGPGLASSTAEETTLDVLTVEHTTTYRYRRPVTFGPHRLMLRPRDRLDLGRMLDRHYPDPADRVGAWARGFVLGGGTDTLALLGDLSAGIRAGFDYLGREEEGTRSPAETLERGSGSCRDIRQVVPIAGSFQGVPEDYLGMEVDVTVRPAAPGDASPARRAAADAGGSREEGSTP